MHMCNLYVTMTVVVVVVVVVVKWPSKRIKVNKASIWVYSCRNLGSDLSDRCE
jgi:hypothetical protein